MKEKSTFKAWLHLTRLYAREAAKDLWLFLLRQLVMLCLLLLLLGITSVVVPFFFRLPSGLSDVPAIRRCMNLIATFLLFGYTLLTIGAFVGEIRRDMRNVADERRRRRRAAHAQQDAEILAAFAYLRLVRLQKTERYLAQSEALAATPSLLQGVGSILDVGDTLTQYNEALDGPEADRLAMQHDRLMVGRDLKNGLEKAVKRTGLEGRLRPSERTEFANG